MWRGLTCPACQFAPVTVSPSSLKCLSHCCVVFFVCLFLNDNRCLICPIYLLILCCTFNLSITPIKILKNNKHTSSFFNFFISFCAFCEVLPPRQSCPTIDHQPISPVDLKCIPSGTVAGAEWRHAYIFFFFFLPYRCNPCESTECRSALFAPGPRAPIMV